MRSLTGLHVENYTLLNKIGEGHFAQVWRAVHRILRVNLAIKIIDTSSMGMNKELIYREIDMMKRLDHPYIVKLLEHFEKEDHIFLVMENLGDTTIKSEVIKEGKIPEDIACVYITQVIQAVRYMHSKNVIHRDIKAENVMIDENNNIRIVDFGLSNYTSIATTSCGSPVYAPPEMILRQNYNEKADVYSIGVLLYYMLCGKYPFFDHSVIKLMQMVVNNPIEFDCDISEKAKDFIGKLMNKDQEVRISLEDALKHQWIREKGIIYDIDLDNYLRIDHQCIKLLEVYNINTTLLAEKLEKGENDKDTVMYHIAHLFCRNDNNNPYIKKARLPKLISLKAMSTSVGASRRPHKKSLTVLASNRSQRGRSLSIFGRT